MPSLAATSITSFFPKTTAIGWLGRASRFSVLVMSVIKSHISTEDRYSYGVFNILVGMDLWNPSAGIRNMKMQPNQTVATPMQADQWVQADCEELQARVEALNSENHSLRDELQRLSDECGKLTSENNSIKVCATSSLHIFCH
ncbi:G-box-binding factor 1-like protein isoform X1 [Tanacetum coccineum]